MSQLVLPPGVDDPRERSEAAAAGVLIDNRTGLTDELVQGAVETYFVEHASLSAYGQISTFQTYAAEGGSLLARARFQTPANVYDEIRLARDLADRDDDVKATIGQMLATAFSDGMENHHPDEKTVELFNGLARHMNLDLTLKRIYREYLIAQQVTTISLFQRRQTVAIGNEGEDETMVAPLIGILPAERVRTIGPDLFGTAELAYVPDGKLAGWLQAYFEPSTSAARKAELRRQDPVSAVLFTGPVELDERVDFTSVSTTAYRLNPRMAHRSKAPDTGETPRPLLTSSFALLEAKRLLNLMDYALLQGGMNFIVVAKKGSDERPAMPQEIENLQQVVRRASRTGVIVGDHRLSFEIITPDLESLLSKDKRTLLGRNIAASLLRLPELPEGAAAEGMRAELEFMARTISSDRHDIKRHVENHIYEECAQRNRDLTKGVAKLWFPKIILQGSQYFTDYVLKLRDRGDIPRKSAVEAAGFDWEAGVEQRRREVQDDIDETMAPAAVPFSSPAMGPQDNNSGRPPGSSPNNGAPNARPGTGQDPARPRRRITRNAGETVRAVLDEDGQTRRIGELTYAILDEYPERTIGRVTAFEREAIAEARAVRTGPLAVIPVNPGYEVADLRAVRLAAGLSILVGERKGDRAIVAKALSFREPEFDPLDAEETALRWGFPIEGFDAPEEEHAQLPAAQLELPSAPTVVVNGGGRVKKIVRRDEHGNISEIEEVTLGDG